MKFSRQLVVHTLGWLVALTLPGSSVPATVLVSPEARGYRVVDYRWDAVLLQRWAVLQDSAHPERPLLAERVASSKADLLTASQAVVAAAAITNAVTVIHMGDLVTLWSKDGNVWLQLGAVSQQNAAVGDRIQLRVTGAGVNGNTGWQATGIVRGPGSVEMER